jgi:hypothetical protein
VTNRSRQTDRYVLRLKALKRAMFGRAKLDLLRLPILHPLSRLY